MIDVFASNLMLLLKLQSVLQRRAIIATLKLYHDEIKMLCKEEIVQERKELFKFINEDAFFPLSSWPKDMQLIFWKKPMGDEESFKLLLFFIGNGGGPTLISRWIMLAHFWAESQQKVEKRARQVDFFF